MPNLGTTVVKKKKKKPGILFFETATSLSLEAFKLVIQQFPPFLLCLFSCVVLILHCMTLSYISQTEVDTEGNSYRGFGHMVV